MIMSEKYALLWIFIPQIAGMLLGLHQVGVI